MSFSGEVIKIIDEIAKRFGIIIDWTNQNVIPYLEDLSRRIVLFEIWTSVFWLILGLTFLSLSINISRKVVKGKIDRNNETLVIASALVIIFGGAIGLLMVCFQIYDILHAIFLPEKIIIEFIKNLQSQ